MLKALTEIDGISYVRPKGAFYVFPNISKLSKDDEAVAEMLLREFSVATVLGSGFGSAGARHLRMFFSVPATQIGQTMDRLRRGFERLASNNAS